VVVRSRAHLSDHGVRVAEVEGEVAALHLEVAGLLRGVPGQEDIHLRPQLQERRPLHGEEQVARARAVTSEHLPCVVHTKYLVMMMICSQVSDDVGFAHSFYLLVSRSCPPKKGNEEEKWMADRSWSVL